MRITRIDFAGQTGCHATAQRRATVSGVPNIIHVEIFMPNDHDEHIVKANNATAIYDLAVRMQFYLDGTDNRPRDIHGYYSELLRLADL